jgi:TolB-like protein
MKTKSILYLMDSGTFTAESARTQLQKVLSSAGFARNERLAQFLRFVVEAHLEGKDGDLKESVIAIEVFRRKVDYDPKLDSIVRTQATRLRACLAEYYVGEGRGDPIQIELPKGGYVPVISRRDLAITSPREAITRRLANSGPRTVLWLGLCLGLAIVAAATVWAALSRRGQPATIAVLPLENLGHDPANDYFVDGLTAEIIRNLSVIDGLAVRSQTSSFSFRGKSRDVREAGKQLGVDYLVEGSVLRSGRQLRIDAQLVRVSDDVTVWSSKFDRELTDVFVIQEEISRGIVNNLRLKLARGRRRYETSTEAYDLYLRARALEARVVLFANASQRTELFEKAIERDRSFAPAYAGLAATYASRWAALSPEPADDDWAAKMHAAADKAIELDPLLAEAHRALGFVYMAERQWRQAEQSFRRAIEIDPNSSETHTDFGMQLLLTIGLGTNQFYNITAGQHRRRKIGHPGGLSPFRSYAGYIDPSGTGWALHGHVEWLHVFGTLPRDRPAFSVNLVRERLKCWSRSSPLGQNTC